MTNLSAVSSLCNAIASSFHPDTATVSFALFNNGLDGSAEAKPKDPVIFRTAAALVMGYIESSRSEGGVSVSVKDAEVIKESLRIWCNFYGLKAEDELEERFSSVSDGSSYW